MNRLINPSLRLSVKACALSLVAMCASSGFAATYYVATTGSDSNAGTLAAPFKSITKAQSVASSGDTVSIRGGTYSSFTIAANDSTYNYVHQLSKSGITYAAYSGETPTFNFSSVTTAKRVCAFQVTGSNIKIQGIVVTGTPVGSQKQSENFRITGSSASCAFTRVVCRDSKANGFYFTSGGSGSCTNCDAYNNIGGTSTANGNTDGFGAHGKSVTFSNCRSWHNSDDGYDCISVDNAITFDHCWAYNMTAGGDSNGFKVGGYGTSGTVASPMPSHTVKYCLSASNGSHSSNSAGSRACGRRRSHRGSSGPTDRPTSTSCRKSAPTSRPSSTSRRRARARTRSPATTAPGLEPTATNTAIRTVRATRSRISRAST